MELTRTKLTVILLCLFVSVFMFPSLVQASMQWDKDIRYKLTSYDTWIQFSDDVTVTYIGFDSDRIKFYSAQMGGSSGNLYLGVQNANLTVTTLWVNNEAEFSLSGSGTAVLSLYETTKPNAVYINDDATPEDEGWSYSGTTLTVNCPLQSTGTVKVNWVTSAFVDGLEDIVLVLSYFGAFLGVLMGIGLIFLFLNPEYAEERHYQIFLMGVISLFVIIIVFMVGASIT